VEHPRGDRADRPGRDVTLTVEGIHERTALERSGHRIEREVAARKVVFDAARQRREVDGASVLERDPPGSMTLGERKRSAPACPGERACRAHRLAAGDVDVDDATPEQLVSQGAPHKPPLPSLESLAQLVRELNHRRTRAALAQGPIECKSSPRS
jgi:hypothetical protein